MERELCLHCVLCESFTVQSEPGYGCALCDVQRETGYGSRGRIRVMFVSAF